MLRQDIEALRSLVEEDRKIDKKLRSQVASAFAKVGLDGNKSFKSVGAGINAMVGALNQYGIELDDVPSANLFLGDSGQRQLHLAWSNPTDAFSPESIHNVLVNISWHKHASGNYEIITYLT